MTYIQLLNRFWELHKKERFSKSATTLYMFLLNECNAVKWENPMTIQTSILGEYTGLSRKYLGTARNELEDRGLIKHSEAKGRGPSAYFIDGVHVTDSTLYADVCVAYRKRKEGICVAYRKHKTDLCCIEETQKPFVLPIGNTKGNTKAVCVAYRKHKNDGYLINKYNNIDSIYISSSSNACAHVREEKPKIYSEVEELKNSPVWLLSMRKNHNLSEEEIMKWLDAFPDHCIAEGSEKHSNISDAKKHFNSYLRIKLNPYERKGTNTPDDRLSERRGFDPTSEVRKGFKGTL